MDGGFYGGLWRKGGSEANQLGNLVHPIVSTDVTMAERVCPTVRDNKREQGSGKKTPLLGSPGLRGLVHEELGKPGRILRARPGKRGAGVDRRVHAEKTGLRSIITGSGPNPPDQNGVSPTGY